MAYGPSEPAPYGHPNLPGVPVSRARGVQVPGPIPKSYEPVGPAANNQNVGAPLNFVCHNPIIVQNQVPAPVVIPPGAFYPPPPPPLFAPGAAPEGPMPIRVNRIKVETDSEDDE